MMEIPAVVLMWPGQLADCLRIYSCEEHAFSVLGCGCFTRAASISLEDEEKFAGWTVQ
jgi:hypothetical protein